RRDNRTDVAAGIEQPDGERAFLLREPFRDGLERRREIAGFPKPEHCAHEAERCDARRARSRDRSNAPDDNRSRKAGPDADAIEQASREQQSDAIREAEPRYDVAVLDLAPMQLALQRRCENAEDLSVDVADRGRAEEQRDDGPSIAESTCRDSGRG